MMWRRICRATKIYKQFLPLGLSSFEVIDTWLLGTVGNENTYLERKMRELLRENVLPSDKSLFHDYKTASAG